MSISSKNHSKQELNIESAIHIEIFLRDHIEANFFNLKSSKKIDDQYFNETLIKQLTDKPYFDYSICSLRTLFKIMKKLEDQSIHLICNYVEDVGMISERALDHVLMLTNKKSTVESKDIIYYFINSHISNITEYLYDKDANVNNYEVEDKICFSLQLIKKIIKDYSFYFSKTQLENIYMSLKKFKE